MGKKVAIATAMLMSVTGIASASVLIQNYQEVEFSAGAPPCLIKTASDDTTFQGFGFDATATNPVDGVELTEEFITIEGVTGDRVSATDVFDIENNCNEDLTVNITNAVASGNWDGRSLTVYIGEDEVTNGFPGESTATGWAANPIEINETGVVNDTTAQVVIPAGEEIPVGMVVLTAADADDVAGTGTANWVINAVADDLLP